MLNENIRMEVIELLVDLWEKIEN